MLGLIHKPNALISRIYLRFLCYLLQLQWILYSLSISRDTYQSAALVWSYNNKKVISRRMLLFLLNLIGLVMTPNNEVILWGENSLISWGKPEKEDFKSTNTYISFIYQHQNNYQLWRLNFSLAHSHVTSAS